MHQQRSRLLGSLILLLVAGTLALTACNSSSGGSSKASNTVTGTESAAPAKAPEKGTLVEAWVRQLRSAP